MDLSQLSGFVFVVVGVVLVVTTVQLFSFRASEASLASARKMLHENIETIRRLISSFSLRRRKAA